MKGKPIPAYSNQNESDEESEENRVRRKSTKFNNINIQNQYNNIIHIDNQELLRDLLLTSPRTDLKSDLKPKKSHNELDLS